MSDASHATDAAPAWLTALAARARDVDDAPPFSDQTWLDLASGVKRLEAVDQDAAAIVGAADAELVVDPAARGRGLGHALVQRIARPGLLVWAHGDLAPARALAARWGAEPVRRLLRLVADVPPAAASDAPQTGQHALLSLFRPGVDETEWVALNARVFASHPEQGRVSVDDLVALEAEPWFDASAFLVARDRDGAMSGYCWLKIESGPRGEPADEGEIYVLGTARRHGEGSRLLRAGLGVLASRGIRRATLYVEGDNAVALALYTRMGFVQDTVDVQYRLP